MVLNFHFDKTVQKMSALASLIEAFRCLPGVGAKTAQRMTLHLLERDRDGAQFLSMALTDAIEKIGKEINFLTSAEKIFICGLILFCLLESLSNKTPEVKLVFDNKKGVNANQSQFLFTSEQKNFISLFFSRSFYKTLWKSGEEEISLSLDLGVLDC